MMQENMMQENMLVIFENGEARSYLLDDREQWRLGRTTDACCNDIQLYSRCVSRNHGRFVKKQAKWYYQDQLGKNGTIYNGEHINSTEYYLLAEGDYFRFGCKKADRKNGSAAGLYTEVNHGYKWHCETIENQKQIMLSDGRKTVLFDFSRDGMVRQMENGLAVCVGNDIYMTEKIYMCNRMQVGGGND